jgi:hypothetical protein
MKGGKGRGSSTPQPSPQTCSLAVGVCWETGRGGERWGGNGEGETRRALLASPAPERPPMQARRHDANALYHEVASDLSQHRTPSLPACSRGGRASVRVRVYARVCVCASQGHSQAEQGRCRAGPRTVLAAQAGWVRDVMCRRPKISWPVRRFLPGSAPRVHQSAREPQERPPPADQWACRTRGDGLERG